MMNSTNDKSKDVQNFLKIIKEKGKEKDMQDMLNRMTTTEKVDNFLQQNQMNELMGGQEIAGGFPKVYNPAGLPDDVYQSIMRQYNKKGFGPYTTEDKIRVQNFYKQV